MSGTYIQHVGLWGHALKSFHEFTAKTPLDFYPMRGFDAAELGIIGCGPYFDALEIPGVVVAACMAKLPDALAAQSANRDLSGLVAYLRRRGTS